ncbi:MAG: hypothetical protein I8H96_00695 [Sphingomonadaceae bacterium]|nr:hypothetical protein [Sphingomonadaceae bacterium]
MTGPFNRILRSSCAAFAALVPFANVQAADPAPFDLAGPELSVSVTRGERTLPIGKVPALAAGDVLEISANLPSDQSIHYLLVSAFLRGVTNPPPKKWLATAETWARKDKKRIMKLTVPADARQLVLFMVPDTGGDFGTIADAVRGKPGEFVRVTQDINHASLDRSRLNAFAAGIRSQENSHPEYLKSVAPILSSSLAVKLNEDCLAKLVDSQAACLLENRDALVLGDVHSNSLTETITGAPADLALQISATREGGYGFYSPYIGVVRDLARIFGAFNNPEFTYLPALGTQKDDKVSLLLNSAPSFRKPKSVLVAAMPAIEKDVPPPLRPVGDDAVCAARSDALFRVDGAPLIYATDYAHDMAIRLTTRDGRTVDAPVIPRADRGGYVLAKPLNITDFEASTSARLHGAWGFNPFDGPEYIAQFPQAADWQVETEAQRLIVGRDNMLPVKGAAPACVEKILVQLPGGQSRSVEWEVSGSDGIAVKMPLTDARAGDVQVVVKTYGITKPTTLTVRAYAEESRIDNLRLYAGDDTALLTGLRLDQIKGVSFDGAAFRPGLLSREGNVDTLQIIADDPEKARALARGYSAKAQIMLKDGRAVSLPVTVAAARPAAMIVTKSIDYKAQNSTLVISLSSDDLLPDIARMSVSLRAADGIRFSPRDIVEVATADDDAPVKLSASNGLRLESQQIAIASFDPATLGPSAFGPLRYRLVQAGVAGNWQPLATLVRLPAIENIACNPAGAACRMAGRNLFLIEAVSDERGFAKSMIVPNGFTGDAIAVPPPQGKALYMKLRDAPDLVQEIRLPG